MSGTLQYVDRFTAVSGTQNASPLDIRLLTPHDSPSAAPPSTCDAGVFFLAGIGHSGTEFQSGGSNSQGWSDWDDALIGGTGGLAGKAYVSNGVWPDNLNTFILDATAASLPVDYVGAMLRFRGPGSAARYGGGGQPTGSTASGSFSSSAASATSEVRVGALVWDARTGVTLSSITGGTNGAVLLSSDVAPGISSVKMALIISDYANHSSTSGVAYKLCDFTLSGATNWIAMDVNFKGTGSYTSFLEAANSPGPSVML